MKRKLISVILLVSLIGSLLCSFNGVFAASAAEVTQALNDIKSIYNGKYWNAYLQEDALKNAVANGYATPYNDFSTSERMNKLGLTYYGCKSSSQSNGTCTSNKFDDGIQCDGFARFIFYYLYEKKPSAVTQRGSNITVTSLQPGDFIRTPKDHSAIVWKIEGDTLYCVEAWGSYSSKHDGCIIKFTKGFNGDYSTSSASAMLKQLKEHNGFFARGGTLILRNHVPGVDCKKFATIKENGKTLLGACTTCHTEFNYSKITSGDVAGLWIAKKNQKINLYNAPYEDATYTSVKSGELEVRGYVKNAYGNKWYVINGDKNKTYYVYENTFKNLYTQDSHYYENDYHSYDSGYVIEDNTNNDSLNGNTVVGTVDIPSSWDNLSIRSGPGTSYAIVGSMNDGVRCNVYPDKTKNGWYYVEYNGVYGYASGNQINTGSSSGTPASSNPTPTVKPSTSAGISLSTSNVNLSYPDSLSQTITVTATGDLPNTYTFSLEMDGYVYFNWGSWSGNSIPLTFTAHENSKSCTPKIHLKDSASGNICATISFNVNVSVTKPAAKEYVNVYFDSKGGSVEYAAQTVEKYGTISIPTKKPSKSGYEFLGWSTDRNALSALYLSGDTVNVGNTNLTFYAVYREEDASWDEWDLRLSESKLYFDASDSKQIILVKLLEHNGKKEGVDYDLEITKDDHLSYKWGDSWYDDDGYRCTELEIYNPKRKLDKQQVSVLLLDEDGYIASSKNFSVIYEEKSSVQFADRNQTGISVYLNGEKLIFDVQPQIINGRTMVPMRKIFEELGTVVGWNNNTRTAVAVRKGDVVRIGIGGQYMTCNGEQKLLDSPAVVISGRTLVPVRAIAESLNCDVEWYDYGVNQVVDINMKDTVNKMENIGGLLIGWCEYAPFSYLDDNGTLIGFDTELAEYVCKFWGWNVAFTEIPFDQKFTAINSGRIDCYWNGVTRTEEREELCTFTDEYVSFDMQYEEDGEWYTSHEVYSVPFRKGDYDTVQLVNIALEEAKKDGTIEHLKFKYGIE